MQTRAGAPGENDSAHNQSSVGARAPEDCSYCLCDDHNVSYHRPVVDIRQIQTNSFIPRKIGSATDLPQAGNTRLNEQPSQYFAIVGFNFAPQRWTRTHDTHLMAEHIDKLRQLIDTETPQYDDLLVLPRVVSDLEQETVSFIGVQQVRQLLVGVIDHCAELQHGKRLAIDSDAFRGVEDWAPDC